VTILDTSVIIDFLLGEEKAINAVATHAKKGPLKTTTITEYELLKHGNLLKREIAQKFLTATTILPFDSASAQQAAALYEKLQKNGTPINENDLLIAGITVANDEVLLTRDKKFVHLNQTNIQII
jgi:tRNA(fMet)-specific endonuclease VapC